MVDAGKINVLVLDVDGVLTDGSLMIHGDGSESKTFNTVDGHGIKLWQRAGNTVAFLSGRESAPTGQRAMQLGVAYCFQNCHDKLGVLDKLVSELGVDFSQVAYIGDDLPDLPAMRAVGFGVAVANAVDQMKHNADYVTKCCGGDGAVREVIEYLLKKSGKWDALIERYVQ